MFSKGFEKVAGTFGMGIVPRTLKQTSGISGQQVFGNPISNFGKSPKKGLMPISRLRDGLK